MKRIAIIGGGISGLTAAYEFEKARQAGAPLEWHLYEAIDRLGGIIETTRISCSEDGAEGEYILEGGPDGWVTEKPWAHELAIELGLADELIYSKDATRKTYIYLDGELQAIPDGMRLMVPEDLSALEGSPLFSASAKQAYADELARAEDLQRETPFRNAAHDESIASFVLRHFGHEVLNKLAAPLLSGVFGGDVHKLSVRAVMPQFVRMERAHGSLILALQHAKGERRGQLPQPIFTTLRRGAASLVEALVATLPPDRVVLSSRVTKLVQAHAGFELSYTNKRCGTQQEAAHDAIVVATPLDVTRQLVDFHNSMSDDVLPINSSSAILINFAWPQAVAQTFSVPKGFGFLIPCPNPSSRPERAARSGETPGSDSAPNPQLLAATFADQKFPHRAPPGARILRAFFGSNAAEHFASASDETISDEALKCLIAILGPLPKPEHTKVVRWPRSLPQYEVGHLARMAQLDELVAAVPGLTLLGNSYRGVGLPDLIRDAQSAARRIVLEAQQGPEDDSRK